MVAAPARMFREADSYEQGHTTISMKSSSQWKRMERGMVDFGRCFSVIMTLV